MDIKRLYYTLQRKAWLLVLLALIGCGLAIFYNSFFLVPIYRADSTLFIISQNTSDQSIAVSDINLSRLIAQDYSEIIYSRRVTSEVVNQLRPSGIPGLSEERIRAVVSVSNQKDSSLVTVSAVWTDPQTATLISNTTSTVLASKINELIGSNYVQLLDEARNPQVPISGSATRNVIVGIMAGLLMGCGIVYLIALFDTKIRSVEDIKAFEVIGIIPEHTIGYN